MSPIANLSSAPSALSAITAHSHSHKKGSRVESTNDSDGDAMTPVPAGTQQNLFTSMLNSLEQVLGVQPATSGSASTGTAARSATSGGSTASSPAAATPITPASAAATASTTAALQKYLHNVSSQSNDVRFPTVAGSTVSANA